jgi:2-polyprenyl-6-methoxyphenol hydroxylase-like FAD-dependent oxidoreductase
VTGSSGATVASDSRIGLGATFHDPTYPVQPGDLHMIVGRAGYVGIVRVESGALNVAAAVDPGVLRGVGPERLVANLLSSCGLRPLGGIPTTEWRGTPLLTRSSDDVGAERLFRLGDAAGYIEPFTGEGMCWALGAATAVTPLALAAATAWDAALLESWRDYQRTTMRRARRLCRIVAPALRRPWLVDGIVATLSVLPGLAAPIVRRAARPPSSSPAYSA